MHKLDVNQPEISVFNKYANIISIASCYDNDITDWLCNNFILTYAPNDFTYGLLTDFFMPDLFKACPYIWYHPYTRGDVRSLSPGILDFVYERLDEGVYLYMDADVAFLPVYRRQGIHNIFLFGYDKEEKILFAADNLFDGKYSYFQINADDFCHAYENVENGRLPNIHYFDRVDTFQYRENREYGIDAAKIRQDIICYLNGTNPNERYHNPDEKINSEWVYGINCYELMKEYILLVQDEKARIDIRAFHLNYEHKLLMEKRVNRLLQGQNHTVNEQYLAWFTQLKQKSLMMRNLAIKYSLASGKENQELINRILEMNDELKLSETKLLNDLLSMLP